MRKSLLLLTLLLAPFVHAQSTPTWFKIVAAEDAAITLTFPAFATVRWCDADTGTICSPAITLPPGSTMAAYCPGMAECATADQSDGLQGVLKDVEVIENAIPQNVTVTKSGNAVAAVIPALPGQTVTFTGGAPVIVSVSNIPPATNTSPLQGLVTLTAGNTVVKMICSYITTWQDNSTTPPSFQAAFECKPVAK